MGPDIILAVVTTLLLVSLALNAYLWFGRTNFEDHWLARETRALDRARAAELRAGEQIDAMLDRVSKAPALTMQPVEIVPDVKLEQRKYFADDDDPVEQAAWDEARDREADNA